MRGCPRRDSQATSPADLGQGPDPLDDAAIVRRILGGERCLFELIMRRYNQRLFRITRAILRDPHEAEEVVQQAYVNAYTNLRQFSGQASFATWLTKIAVHEAYARARRRLRVVTLSSGGFNQDGAYAPYGESAMKDRATDPEAKLAAAQVRTLLEKAVDSLRPAFREVFMLREIEGMSTAETAACLGISTSSVKVRLHRGKAQLRKALSIHAHLRTATPFPFLGPRCDRMVRSVFQRLGLGQPTHAA